MGYPPCYKVVSLSRQTFAHTDVYTWTGEWGNPTYTTKGLC